MASRGIFIIKDIVKAKAFRSLSGIAILVYLDFLMKRKMQPIKAKRGRQDSWVIINNGDIEYTYSEAEKKGITRSRFMRAIDDLVAKGFIDIIHSGSGGQKGDKSKYAISERWRKWGTDEFVEKERPKDRRQGRGFAVYWRTKKANIGNETDTPTVIETVTSMAT